MSGEGKSAAAKLDELEDKLDKYEEKIGLVITPRISKYLNIEREQMQKMSVEELEEAAFDLANYGIFFQKEYNKHMSRVNWAEANLRLVVAKEANNVKAYSPDERKAAVILSNEHAYKLEQIRVNEQACVDRLNFINRRIDLLSEQFAKIKEGRQRRNKYG